MPLFKPRGELAHPFEYLVRAVPYVLNKYTGDEISKMTSNIAEEWVAGKGSVSPVFGMAYFIYSFLPTESFNTFLDGRDGNVLVGLRDEFMKNTEPYTALRLGAEDKLLDKTLELYERIVWGLWPFAG
jgi:hypothetical protein